MQLGRMDDVAGCRLIFKSVDKLRSFRTEIHAARFKHRLKNTLSKYDYIANPKNDGYRGIHDVYAYDVQSEGGRSLKGLLIELQYRTIFQHAWATCVEIVGFLTENQPKFGRGDVRFSRVLRLASEIISRAFEQMKSSLPDNSDKDIIEEFLKLDKELGFMQILRDLNRADRQILKYKNIVLIFKEEPTGTELKGLEIKSYRTAPPAMRALFELERELPGTDIVLVKGDRPEDLREAFNNYFSDAHQFIKLIDDGCNKLQATV